MHWPVIRRDFLEQHGLWYDEECRLGEDFILYTRALAKGARMKVVADCGYAAQVRQNSLSSNHRIEDLRTLHEFSAKQSQNPSLTAPERESLHRHAQSIRRKRQKQKTPRMLMTNQSLADHFK